jgi:transposase
MSHALFVRAPTELEQEALARLVRSNGNTRVVRRAQMVRLSAQGQTSGQIAGLWNLSPLTVVRIVKRFNSEGLASLQDKPRSGRPRKATNRYVELLQGLVMKSPRELGYPFSSWTLDRLREHLTRVTGVILHPLYLSRLMGRHGIVYRRPKHVMSHLRDPKDYDEKKAILEFLKKTRRIGPVPSICCSSMSRRFISTRR